ncbi:putative sodium P-type ATPase [Protomyces lactucae-debilis]|uniref:P-type Na(+) transporter n=1 Tax=Protomyces lactucae-debilis TaxID=2754530 RepID=A0A1Y2FI71_PROLT|nr:putative sodium P-type ATPase [Protomyces lactucae-debilis]ORY83651.1 putative sodium P-type ATPase [Protomyces lactucae-debilis]
MSTGAPSSTGYELSKLPFLLSFKDVNEQIKTNLDSGLSKAEVDSRLKVFGKNELEGDNGVSLGAVILGQVVNSMVLVLIIAMVVSFAVKDWISGGVIAAVIAINIVVGTYQEYQAAKTMDSLKSLGTPSAHCIRDGQDATVPSQDVVPGDIVIIKTGDTVPADLRLFETMNLETDEALLTGEALPVAKDEHVIYDSDETPVGDRLNLVFSSSTVTKGRGKGIVIATGMKTEIGGIAASMRDKPRKVRKPKTREDGTIAWYSWPIAYGLSLGDIVGRFLGVNVGTPLQRKLSQLAVLLFFVAVVFAVVVEAANAFDDQADVVVYAVATGVAMIPASLVVVLTITMSVGTQIMVKRNVIVRNLDSLEALGGVTDVCSDKTGTLTQGKMIVKRAWIPSTGTFSVGPSDNPIDPTQGSVTRSDKAPSDMDNKISEKIESDESNALDMEKPEGLEHFLNIGALCNLAQIKKNDEGVYKATGDPTEIAIQVFAHRFDWGRPRWVSGDQPKWHEVAEFPFDSDVKRMSVVYRNNETEQHSVFAKGAVERVLETCTTALSAEGSVDFDEDFKERTLKNMEALASQGLRVLALAQRPFESSGVDFDKLERAEVEKDLQFIGLVGLYDPPREQSGPAVRKCHKAGINVHMLTGDHPGTARAIAIQVSILPKKMSSMPADVVSAMVMTGAQFDRLSEDEIDNLPVLPLVIARCAPQTKVRMIEALHRRKAFAAMTGDGVNDSPSLKRADVGIAMGMNGSDVAKDASDIVLSDDNFASILNAIEEGRRIFDNIKKFVLHLLAGNIGQALTLLIGLVFLDQQDRSVFPLSPVEILWIIMITSSFPAMGLGMEEATPDVMDREPHDTKTGVFTWEVILDMFVYGFIIGALCVVSFVIVVYGWFDGFLGLGGAQNCNAGYNFGCEAVFRGRTTVFVIMTWGLLLLAFEMIDMRRSAFALKPRRGRNAFVAIGQDWYKNRFLFWSVILGAISVVPVIYIPVINTDAFRHTGIGWEWGLCFAFSILYIACMEAWKWGKRIYYRRKAARAQDGEQEAGQEKHFQRYISMSRSEYTSRATTQ